MVDKCNQWWVIYRAIEKFALRKDVMRVDRDILLNLNGAITLAIQEALYFDEVENETSGV